MTENLMFVPNLKPADSKNWVANSRKGLTYHHAFFVHYGWKRYWLKSTKHEVIQQVLKPIFSAAQEVFAYHLDPSIMNMYITQNWETNRRKLRAHLGGGSFDEYLLLLRKLWTQIYLDKNQLDFNSFFGHCFDPYILKKPGIEFGRSRWQSAYKKALKNNQVVLCTSPGHLIPVFGIRAEEQTLKDLFDQAIKQCRVTSSWAEVKTD
jgi:hypothetical protein